MYVCYTLFYISIYLYLVLPLSTLYCVIDTIERMLVAFYLRGRRKKTKRMPIEEKKARYCYYFKVP